MQYNYTIQHMLEWLKLKMKPLIPLLSKIWSNGNSHKLLLRMQSGISIQEHCLVIS